MEQRTRQWRGLTFGALVLALLAFGAPGVADVGDSVLQGRINTVDQRTILRGSNPGDAMLRVVNNAADGSGVEIRTGGGPPLVVDSDEKVVNLNADKLDGKSIHALMKRLKYDADKNNVVDDAEALGGLAANEYVRADGTFGCAGSSFVPISSTTEHEVSGSMLYRTSGATRFRCSVNAPDGVTITNVAFSVRDDDATNGVTNCEMWRTDMTSSIGSESNMAAAASTSGTPGEVVLSDNTIVSPVVNNSTHTYFVQCALNGTNALVGLYGAVIDYTSTAADAAPAPAIVSATPSDE
ncbi:MAG: hypothetical protein HKN91_03105 [Acidimicrobiia bacterium]|nr:hypothetical protein [Acidimicrobiia bacterium]